MAVKMMDFEKEASKIININKAKVFNLMGHRSRIISTDSDTKPNVTTAFAALFNGYADTSIPLLLKSSKSSLTPIFAMLSGYSSRQNLERRTL